MMGRMHSGTVNAEKSFTFPSNRWTLIQRLHSASEPRRKRAFEELCQAYWKPLYVFARRAGDDHARRHLDGGQG
jgi:hypothetical protein